MLLEVSGLNLYYGSAKLVHEINMEVEEGELVGIIGPNGAGKTTILRTISGLVTWDRDALGEDVTMKGTITFNGEEINHLYPHEILKRGLALSPEREQVFPEMTVLENLQVGSYSLKGEESEEGMKAVYDTFPLLEGRSKQLAGTLSGGERQMLAIGKSLMSKPKLLCIDEPSLGLAPKIRKSVFKRIKDLRKEGVTILVVEQDASSLLDISDRNYVISSGEIVGEGTKDDILGDRRIKEDYLGL